MFRQPAQVEQVQVGQVTGPGQALDGGDPGAGAGGDHRPAECDALSVDLHLPRTGEACGAEDHLAAVGTEPFRIVVPLDVADDPGDMIGHRTQVHLRFHRLEAAVTGAAHGVGYPGGMDQGLAGHAAVMQAVTAEGRLLLDQDHVQTQLGGTGGHHQPAGAAADHDQIPWFHARSLSDLWGS